MRLLPKVFASVVVSTLALTACNNSSSTTSPAAGGAASSSTFSATGSPVASGNATVDSTSSDLGTILVDANGMTLYLNTQDTATASSCTGSCAATWPPLTSGGSTKAGSGVQSAQLGTLMVGDTDQITYYGHPLYTYSGDTGPGETNGQGVGGVWYVVSTKGTPVKGSSSGGDSNRGGGY
jgi:predicted lipoprotein with Yx(FWY)xxD motif